MKAKIYKVLGILLALAVVFSTCACMFGTVYADSTEYEVSSTGTYKTIDEVIIAANAAGKVAGDVVTAKIADNDEVLMSDTSDFSTEHAFTLVITSANGAKLATEGGENKRNIILGGPTIFDNVEINVNGKSFRANGKDFTFGHGVTFKDGNVNIACVRTGGSSSDVTVSGVSNIEVGVRPVRELQLTNDGAGTLTYEKDVNIVYDDTAETPSEQTVRLGLAGNGNVTFNGNINLNVKSGHVKFNSANTAYINGNIQVINSATMTIQAHCVWDSTSTEFERWDLTNLTPEYKDMIGFIEDVTGKYAIAAGYQATAFDKNGTPYVSAEGVLDLTAGGQGEYTVSIEKLPVLQTYYVSATGDDAVNDGKTPEAPLQTIAGVVFQARDDDQINDSVDVVTVILKDGETINWTNQYTMPGYVGDLSGTHKFKLVVKSENGANLTTNANDMIFGGNTEFENINIDCSASAKTIRFNGYDVKFGANTTFDGMKISQVISTNQAELTETQNIELNSHLGAEFTIGWLNGTGVFNADMNITYNDADATAPQVIKFGCTGGNGIELNNNVNLNVIAGDVTLKDNKEHLAVANVFNGAIQVIDSSKNGVEFNDDMLAVENLYVLTNKTGVADALAFTETAGQYAVKAGYDIVATSVEDPTVSYETLDGVLTIAEPGAYEITRIINVATKYVSAAGSDETGDGSVEAPYATIKAAAVAAGAGLVPGDIVEVKVIGTDAVYWSADSDALPDHVYTLVVASADEAEKATVTAQEGRHITLGGATEFSNIKIEIVTGRHMRLNSFNAKFDEKVEINNITEGLVIGRVLDESKTTVPQYVEFNCAVVKGPDEGIIIGDSNNERKFYHPITITYNAEGSKTHIAFGTSFYQNSVAKKATYFEPINLNIENADEVTFANAKYGKEATPFDSQPRYVFEEGSALQIINSSDAEITATSGELANIDASIKWILTVDSGIDGVISFTDTVGIYNVAEGYDVVVVKNGDDAECAVVDGVLDLTEAGAGEYTVHVRDDKWSCDEENHWFECAGCDYVFEATLGEHTPDHEGGATKDYAILCVDCEYEIEAQLSSDGWVLEGSNWVYYVDGEATTGWKYLDAWYFFDNDGIMQTGWELVDGGWYYMDAYGRMQTGWEKVDGDWYYMDVYGRMQTGWELVGSTWYYMDAYGRMQTGWLLSGSTWYYLDASGAMATGWLKLGTTWYYLQANGAMATGSLNIGGIVYRFNAYGAWVL